jgi:HAMP domain-containing protein
MVQNVWGIIVAKFQYFGLAGTAFLALSYFVVNFYIARKLKLEIQKLRKEIEENNSTNIASVSLDEIVEFASKNPSPRSVRRFIRTMRNSLAEEGPKVKLDEVKTNQYSVALKYFEVRVSRTFFNWEWVLLIYILCVFIHPIVQRIARAYPIAFVIFVIFLFLVLAISLIGGLIAIYVKQWKMKRKG